MVAHGDELLRMTPIETLKPLEETLELQRTKRSLTIGIPKERSDIEKRVPLTPDAVSLLVAHEHTILIETGAGIGAHYDDHTYSDAGAKIVSTTREVFQADIILKMSALSPEEIEMVRMRQTIISSLQIFSSSIGTGSTFIFFTNSFTDILVKLLWIINILKFKKSLLN